MRRDRCMTVDCSGRFCKLHVSQLLNKNTLILRTGSSRHVTTTVENLSQTKLPLALIAISIGMLSQLPGCGYNSHIHILRMNVTLQSEGMTFLFLQQTPLRETSVSTCYHSFLSHKLKTLKEKNKHTVIVSQQKEAPPISVATFDMS